VLRGRGVKELVAERLVRADLRLVDLPPEALQLISFDSVGVLISALALRGGF